MRRAACAIAGALSLAACGDALDGKFVLQPRVNLTAPRAAGDTRHVISLTRLAGSVYRWDTSVEYAMGSISAGEVAALFEAVLTSARARPEQEARADYRG